jgi:hypothetical protein
MSVGNGSISTNGLVFIIDSFNSKSYNVINVSDLSGTDSYIPYYGTTPSITLSIPGNSSEWIQYIVLNEFIDINLIGGLYNESYRVDSVTYDENNNITILHQHDIIYDTLTYSCIMDNVFSGGPWFVKVPNIDISVGLKIYASNEGNELVLNLSGGTNSSVTQSNIYSTTLTGLSMSSSNIISFSGNNSQFWNNLIVPYSGSMPLYLSGGSMSEVYNISSSFYNGDTDETYLYGLTNSSTYSISCSNYTGFGPNHPMVVDVDLSVIFGIYLPLTLYLSGGSMSEVYNVQYVEFDGTNTILYDDNNIGTLYNDHTQFDISVPGILSTQYVDNITATYTALYFTESYTVQNFYFDGTDTYVYDNSYLGALNISHTDFNIVVKPIIGTIYDDHTYFTYSHPSLPPTNVNNISGDYVYSLVNGVSFNKRDFVFDGVDDYINVGSLPSVSGDFTLNIWYNSSSIVDYRNLLDFNGDNTMLRIEQYSVPGYQSNWSNANQPGGGLARMSVNFNLSGDGSFAFGGDYPPYVLSENTWYNLVAVFDSLTKYAKVYLNGVKYIDQNVPNDWVGYINDFRIGDGYDYSSRRFQGKMPYVSIYNRPLSDGEVISNYESMKWRFK